MKIIFLDRDGVINKYPGDFKYVTRLEDFHLLAGVGSAIKKLNAAGYEIFVASNQAGVSKGAYSQETLDLITQTMLKELKKEGANIKKVHYCTHKQEENCLCRKPKTGLVDQAVKLLKEEGKIIDLSRSYFIGDTERDIVTGKSAGLNTILVLTGKERSSELTGWTVKPDFISQDLNEAVEHIIKGV